MMNPYSESGSAHADEQEILRVRFRNGKRLIRPSTIAARQIRRAIRSAFPARTLRSNLGHYDESPADRRSSGECRARRRCPKIVPNCDDLSLARSGGKASDRHNELPLVEQGGIRHVIDPHHEGEPAQRLIIGDDPGEAPVAASIDAPDGPNLRERSAGRREDRRDGGTDHEHRSAAGVCRLHSRNSQHRRGAHFRHRYSQHLLVQDGAR